jgi:EAL domain-containing protein (putative c-di-GMP-specific phosphodiesterase class I)
MYRAKERGRNCFEIYSVDMNAAAEARLALEGDLHQALDSTTDSQLRVAYQPQIDLLTGRLIGVEALARWDHPTLGPIAPDTFIPLAEESGLIVDLDDWVMRTACAQVRAWRDAGLPSVRMAVNLSGRAFWRARIVERVTEVLTITGVDPEQLELEVTESMAVDAVTDTRPLFRELEALGVRLAIDDFGTGYSALGRLQGLPFHTLKIDRSFVVGVENPHDEAPIVAAMIAMAHALKLEVVAEGVETEAQQSFLARNGCDMAQGFLFSRPVGPDEIEALLRPESALAIAG